MKVDRKGMLFTRIMINMADRDQIREGFECQTRDFEVDSVDSGMSLNIFIKVDKMNLEAGYKVI